MSETIKPGQALSHGVIYNEKEKKKEADKIKKQIEEFLKKGGKIDKC